MACGSFRWGEIALAALAERIIRVARNHFHERRADVFIRLMDPAPGTRVLDLGSGWGDPFLGRITRRVPLDVTLADITEGPTHDAERLGFRSVLLQEDGPLPFDDGEFDIVVSNSVIEHVTLPKEECVHAQMSEAEWRGRALKRQKAFANEIRRVGKRYFVQTPHKHFPLDLHTWLPFTHWLSHASAQRVIAYTDRFWIKHCGYVDWHLLGEAEMQGLFPEARLHVECVAGLPKSLIAYT